MASEMEQHIKEFAEKPINLMITIRSLRPIKWRELTLESCSLTFTGTLCQVHSSLYTQN